MTTVRAQREGFSGASMIDLSPMESAALLLRSFICGIALGIFYDVIRFIKLFCGVKYGEVWHARRGIVRVAHFLLTFVTDIIFWVAAGLMAIALIYDGAQGGFRGLVLIGMSLGLVSHYFTLGRLLLFLSKKLSRGLRFLILRAARLIFIPISFIFKGIISLYHLTIGKIIGKIVCRMRAAEAAAQKLPESLAEGETPEEGDGGGKEDFVYVQGKIGYRRTDRIDFGAYRQGK